MSTVLDHEDDVLEAVELGDKLIDFVEVYSHDEGDDDLVLVANVFVPISGDVSVDAENDLRQAFLTSYEADDVNYGHDIPQLSWYLRVPINTSIHEVAQKFHEAYPGIAGLRTALNTFDGKQSVVDILAGAQQVRKMREDFTSVSTALYDGVDPDVLNSLLGATRYVQ